MKRFIYYPLIGIALAFQAFAGPFEDACKAYEKDDWVNAMRLLKPFAERGNARAQFYLGYMYDLGYGVTRDSAEAVNWYRKAALQGYRSAQNNLGTLYELGEGVKKDERLALQWYRKAAEQHYAVAERNIASFYKDGTVVKEDQAEAAKWYRLAATHGDAHSQFVLAKSALEDDGIIPKDYSAALSWLKEAEAQGHSEAKCCLGLVNELGLGVPKDAVTAFAYYNSAADSGSINAEYHLGTLYERGVGVDRDLSKAVELYTKAAEVGHPPSQLNLARLLSSAPYSHRDPFAAYKWLRLAEDYGLEVPEKFSQDILSSLPPAQVTEADKAVAIWKDTHPQDQWPSMPADPHVAGSSWGEVLEPNDGRLASEKMSFTLVQSANLDKSFSSYTFRDYSDIYLNVNSDEDGTPVRFHCPERVATLAGLGTWEAGSRLGVVSYSTNSRERTVTGVLPYSLDPKSKFSVGKRRFQSLLGWRTAKSSGKITMSSPVQPSYFLISEITYSEQGILSINLGTKLLTSPVEVSVEGTTDKIRVFRGEICGAAIFIVKPVMSPTTRIYKAHLIGLCAPANELDFYVDLMSYWLSANLSASNGSAR